MFTSQRSTRPWRVDKLDEGETLVGRLDALGTRELIDREAIGDGGSSLHRLAHRLEDLEPEAGAVLERAAIAVGAAVEMARQRLHRQVPWVPWR